MSKMVPKPECYDKRHCFARFQGKCRILMETYEDGECPFCKRHIYDKCGKEKNIVVVPKD